jgi:hypothetical protein
VRVRGNKRHGALEDSDGNGGFAPMSAIQALPSASPKADDVFQGPSGQDVPAQAELIHFGLNVNIRFLRIPAGWGRRKAAVADRGGGRRVGD